MHGHQRGAGGLRGLRERTRGGLDAEAGEQGGDLGEGQAQPVVQPGRPRFGDRPDLRSGGAERVGGLVGVQAPGPPAAVPAPSDPHPEPGRHRPQRRQVHLPLLGVAFVVDAATAVRATPRQRRGQIPVRRARRHRPVAVAAMRVARLAARPLRLRLRRALGERCRLALACPAFLAQASLQLGVTCPQLLVLRGQLRHGRLEPPDQRFQLRDPVPSTHSPWSTPTRAIRGGPARTARNPRSTRYPSTYSVEGRRVRRVGVCDGDGDPASSPEQCC